MNITDDNISLLDAAFAHIASFSFLMSFRPRPRILYTPALPKQEIRCWASSLTGGKYDEN